MKKETENSSAAFLEQQRIQFALAEEAANQRGYCITLARHLSRATRGLIWWRTIALTALVLWVVTGVVLLTVLLG